MPDVGNLERREASQTGAIQVAGLDHLVLRVADLDRAIKFYEEVLGCHVERRLDEPKLVQLRAGSSMIDLVPAGPAPQSAEAAAARNLDHFAVRISTFDFQALAAHLRPARHRRRRGQAALWRRGLRLLALHHRPRRQRRRAQGPAGKSRITAVPRDPVAAEAAVACWIASC